MGIVVDGRELMQLQLDAIVPVLNETMRKRMSRAKLKAACLKAMMDAGCPIDASQPVILTAWVPVPGAKHCAMRYIVGEDPKQAANRIAFIEKTPRVRIAPYSEGDDFDSRNWQEGPKGHAPEYGQYQPSRDWCDARLRELGYQLSERAGE